MPTYLPIKVNKRRGHRAKAKSNLPARSSRTGKFLKGHRSNRPKARRYNRPKSRRSNVSKGFHLGRGVSSGTWLRSNHHGRSHGAAYYKAKRRGKARRAGTWKSGWISHPEAPKAAGVKRRGSRGKRRSNRGRALVRYRNRTVVVHRTKRLRNPFGLDGADGLRRLGTWGKIGIGVAFGLGGLAVAFGIPKALAVVTGRDAFQRGWGGVATSAVASLAVGIGVGMVSKRAGLGLLVAAGTGVALLAINALSPKAAQAVIPVNEATLAAMLPTFERAPRMQSGPSDYRPSHDRSLSHVRGPSDFYSATPNTRTSTVGDEASYYGSALAPKERF